VIGQGVLLLAVAALGLPGLGDLPPTSAGRWILLVVGLALMLVGLGVGLAGIRALGRNLTAAPRPKGGAVLVETGIYGAIRHPLYAALILAAIGWGLATASLGAGIATGALAGWLDAKSRREEAWLLDVYPTYAAYRRRTHRFVPGLY
jgi:protein-S-isoprenylcysteine O-methyltransferase Ste14